MVAGNDLLELKLNLGHAVVGKAGVAGLGRLGPRLSGLWLEVGADGVVGALSIACNLDGEKLKDLTTQINQKQNKNKKMVDRPHRKQGLLISSFLSVTY